MPADQFLLRTNRRRVTERGYGSTKSPAEEAADLRGVFELDPLTGYATPRVVLSMADPIALDAIGDDWLESQPYLLPDGTYGDAWTYGGDGAWTLTTSVDMEAGWGFYFGFIVYVNGAGAGAGAIELRLPGGL
ncbi:MAG: hypothetical protein HZB16_07245, partial [Armatimonadetes bacterium]|nr:hypothetical protein [Armatimonadota bacterium]